MKTKKKLIRSKEGVFATLKQMIEFYNSYREVLKLNHEEAMKKALDAYFDFYEWLQGELKLENA